MCLWCPNWCLLASAIAFGIQTFGYKPTGIIPLALIFCRVTRSRPARYFFFFFRLILGGRPVRVGIRDRIVTIQVRYASIATVVRITTTERTAKAGTGRLGRQPPQRYYFPKYFRPAYAGFYLGMKTTFQRTLRLRHSVPWALWVLRPLYGCLGHCRPLKLLWHRAYIGLKKAEGGRPVRAGMRDRKVTTQVR